MQDADIYLKTEAGRDEIKSRSRGLSMAVRAILLMVDGQRNVAALRSVIGGSKAPADTLETLFAQGLIEARTGEMQAPTTISTPRIATLARETAPAASDPGAASRTDAAPSPYPGIAPDAPLDLTLATIAAPSGSSVDSDNETPRSQAFLAGRYERLYTMMNEIVRDFLPAHRRYFIQLKIERCGTADELMDLLDTLQAALSRGRGDAFANEVVSRVRNAA